MRNAGSIISGHVVDKILPMLVGKQGVYYFVDKTSKPGLLPLFTVHKLGRGLDSNTDGGIFTMFPKHALYVDNWLFPRS